MFAARNFFMASGALPEPFYNSVQLLLHGNGTNGGTTFTDSSKFGRTMTATGAPTTSTTQVKYGSASMKFPNSAGDRLTVTQAAFAPGTGDFTFEGWWWLGTGDTAADKGMMQMSTTAGGLTTTIAGSLAIFTASGNFGCYANGIFNPGSIAATDNTWYFLSLCRVSGVTKLAVNGVVSVSFADTTNYTATNLVLGGYATTGFLTSGYIDDYRMTIGVGRYPGAYTPPASQFLP